MKIAIAIKGEHLSEELDDRFGRSKYFCIYDIVTKTPRFIKNDFADDENGVGKHVVGMLIEQNIEMIIACEIGHKVKALLEKKKIQMVIMQDNSITGDEVLQKIRIDRS